MARIAHLLSLTLLIAAANSNTWADSTHRLAIRSIPGELQNAKLQVQYSGSISIYQPDEKKPANHLPLDVSANFIFQQQLSGSNDKLQAVRFYEQAQANIKSGQGQQTSRLADTNRHLIVRIKNNEFGQTRYQFASIAATLVQAEYELLKHPVDPLTLIGLIDRKAQIGESWAADDQKIGRLIAVDRVISSDAKFKLKSIKNKIAKVQLFGSIQATVDDVQTEINVSGEIKIDIDAQQAVGARIMLNQVREPGQIAPGFDGQVKSQSATGANFQLPGTDQIETGRAVTGQKDQTAIPVAANRRGVHPFTRALLANHHVRLAGRLVALHRRRQPDGQCSIVQLPNRPADRPLKLAEFEAEVKKMIGTSEVQIVSSNEATTDKGLSALRVVIDGEESGIPIRWLYYHVGNADGRALSFVFTMEQSIAEYFQSADQRLVDQVEFLAPKVIRESKKSGSKASR